MAWLAGKKFEKSFLFELVNDSYDVTKELVCLLFLLAGWTGLVWSLAGFFYMMGFFILDLIIPNEQHEDSVFSSLIHCPTIIFSLARRA